MAHSQFINSAKLQIGRAPVQTLHNSVLGSGYVDNPITGYSEGERNKKLYQEDFMNYALS